MNRKSWVRWLDSFSDNLKSKIENLKLAGLSVIDFALVMVGAVVEAQQPKKIPRIGFLSTAAPPGTPYESFRQGLRDLGYVEGQNIGIEYRYGQGRPRLAELATELVELKVDLIVAQGQAAMIAKTAARAVPVVFGMSGDPVDAGLVDGLASGRKHDRHDFSRLRAGGKTSRTTQGSGA